MKYLLSILLIISSVLSFQPEVAYGQQEERVPYSVKAILPENQKNSDVSYFDLSVIPGESQALKVEVFNSSNEEISVNVSTNAGATNQNGIITYDGSIKEFDESLKYPFDEISKVFNKTLTIPAYQSKIATIDLEIPEEGFDGQILGGIHFVMDNEGEISEGSVGFVNEYAYVIGVNLEQIQEKDLDKEMNIDLIEKLNKLDNKTIDEIVPAINLNDVNPKLTNYRTSIVAKFSNETPIIVSGLDFNAWITEKGDDDILFSRRIEKFSIGPNNIFEFPIDLENKPLKEGEYTFNAKAKNEKEEFEFSMDFIIEEKEAIDVNNQAVKIDNGINWVLISLVTLILLFVSLIIYLYIKRKKKNNKES